VPLVNNCVNEAVGYGKFSQSGSDLSFQLYSSSACSATSGDPVPITHTDCATVNNTWQGKIYSPAPIETFSVCVFVLSFLALLFAVKA